MYAIYIVFKYSVISSLLLCLCVIIFSLLFCEFCSVCFCIDYFRQAKPFGAPNVPQYCVVLEALMVNLSRSKR